MSSADVALRQRAEVISPPAARSPAQSSAGAEPPRRTRTLERNRVVPGRRCPPPPGPSPRSLGGSSGCADLQASASSWCSGTWARPTAGSSLRSSRPRATCGTPSPTCSRAASWPPTSWRRSAASARDSVLGGTVGILVGTIAGLSRVGEEVVDAPLQALRVVPSLALTSLFIIWFGIGETSKVGLIALGAFFPLYLNTFGGIRNVDLRLVEGARIFGLGRFGLATKVMLPGALPQVLIGLRQSIGVAWLTLVVVEQTNAPNGVGSLIIDAREFMRTDIVVVGLLLYALPGTAHRPARPGAREADPGVARLLRGPVMRTTTRGAACRQQTGARSDVAVARRDPPRVRRPRGARRRLAAHRRRRVRRPPRRQRLGQDDHPAGRRRAGPAGHRADDGAREPRRRLPGAPPAAVAAGVAQRRRSACPGPVAAERRPTRPWPTSSSPPGPRRGP